MKAVQAFVAWDDYLPLDRRIRHLERHVARQGFAQAAIIHILRSQQYRAQLAWADRALFRGKSRESRVNTVPVHGSSNFYSLCMDIVVF